MKNKKQPKAEAKKKPLKLELKKLTLKSLENIKGSSHIPTIHSEAR